MKGTLKRLDGTLQRVPGCKSHRECVLSVHLQDETLEIHFAREKASCAPMGIYLCTLGEEGRWRSQKKRQLQADGEFPLNRD